jgi:hypothetical protein
LTSAQLVLEANMEILLDVSLRGASGELRPRTLSNPSIATDRQLKEAIAVTIQADDQMDK